MARPIKNLRWWMVALLFLSTVINYVDRQTLSILARTIQNDLAISDLGYARIVNAFLLAYMLAYLVAGRITDWLGTRVALAVFITWWSIANMLTALARSAFSLGFYRALLGIGEPGNYTAAPKAVAEWIPPQDRGLAVGIYTAGATLGATLAPKLIAVLTANFGWRSTFVITGALGLLWLIPWLWLYRRPQEHPRITAEELALIKAAQPAHDATGAKQSEGQRWRAALGNRATWMLLLSRVLTDPVWYFYLFWFPKYLQDARHLSLPQVGNLAWLVYLGADVGCVLGGWATGLLIRRGVKPVASRLRVMTAAACLLPLGPLVAFAPSAESAVLIAMVVAFAHLTWQVVMTALAVDLFPQHTVATVFGLIAAGSGFGGLVSNELVGRLVTSWSYTPVFVVMGLLHPLALLLVWQVRGEKTQAGSL
jgi:MFS transporter, ACS family, hexuronate transporter